MNNIYLISYTGGMYGEYICTLLSNDDNYYDAGFKHYLPEDNRHGYRSIIDPLHTFDAWDFYSVPNDIRETILTVHNDKHIAMKTFNYKEHVDVNLPNLVKVKFFADDWIFSWLQSGPKGLKMSAITHEHSMSRSWLIPFIEEYNKMPELTSKLIDNVDELTWTEFDMAVLGIYNLADYVQHKIDWHSTQAPVKSGNSDWIYLNPLELFNDPESHIDQWQKVFDTKSKFDVQSLKDYHQCNVELIERTYGKPYEEIKNGDYKQTMIDYLKPMMKIF
jgi:hypothetical protein